MNFDPQVTILDFGNVGYHVSKRLKEVGITIDQVYSRNPIDVKYKVHVLDTPFITDLSDLLPRSDIYLICTNDDGVQDVANILRLVIPLTSTVCHTSGTLSSDIINTHFNNCGCLYPFQSFSKDDEQLDWDEVPVFVTSKLSRVQDKLLDLALLISPKASTLPDDKKLYVHLSGVIANNFTNALIGEAIYILRAQDIDPSVIFPLLNKTISKLQELSPIVAQTGPAKRGDIDTIMKHLQLINNQKELQEIYRCLSLLINPTLTIDP